MADKPELLLPAGDLATAKLAIDHGADAVYVGLARFSARAKATNLSLDEMIEAIEYAHARGAKVFCALNILLFNDELEDAIEAVAKLVAHEIDAFIVQDFGLATLMLSYFPDTEIHASTQMAIMNVSGAQTMEALGFDRVVLARETSLAMMQAIRAGAGIDLEVFVQGALCVSYSGLCLMSSLQGPRSGNRGQCAQPCRRSYRLLAVEKGRETAVAEGYLLSPKDMDLLPDLPALAAVPVQSLKVEGRMKQPEYVALMADVYRRHIDRLAVGEAVSPELLAADLRRMASVFNREGFSSAYLHGVPGRSMLSVHTPRNTGIPLGEIVKLTKQSVTVRLTEPLRTGDGVALYDADLQPLWGGYLERLSDAQGQPGKAFTAGETVVFRHGIEEAAALQRAALCYKTFDKELSKALLKVRKLPTTAATPKKGTLHFYVEAVCGQAFSLVAVFTSARDETTASYRWASDFIVEASRGGRSSRMVISESLCKLANTGYEAGAVEISGEDQIFVPMSVVTKARNVVVAYFDDILQEEVAPEEEAGEPPLTTEERIEECLAVLDEIPPQIRIRRTPRLTVQVRTLAQAEAAIAAGAEELNVLLLDTHRGNGLTDEEIIALAGRLPLLVSLPPLMKETEEEGHFSARCQALIAAGIRDFMVANLGQVKLLEDLGIEYTASDHHLNLTNDLTATALSQIGISRQTLSVELDGARMQALSTIGNIPLELIVYGRLPAMNTRCCPMGNFAGGREVDRPCSRPCRGRDYLLAQEDKRYPLVGDRFCNVYVLNDKMYDLMPHLAEIGDLCLDYWRVAGAFMMPQEIGDAVANLVALRQMLFAAEGGRALHVPVRAHTTQGHFIKGVR